MWLQQRSSSNKIIKIIISRDGIPYVLVSNSCPQFVGKDIKWFLVELHINHRFTSVRHAQTNGHVESTKKVVIEVLKKRVDTLEGN